MVRLRRMGSLGSPARRTGGSLFLPPNHTGSGTGTLTWSVKIAKRSVLLGVCFTGAPAAHTRGQIDYLSSPYAGCCVSLPYTARRPFVDQGSADSPTQPWLQNPYPLQCSNSGCKLIAHDYGSHVIPRSTLSTVAQALLPAGSRLFSTLVLACRQVPARVPARQTESLRHDVSISFMTR
jgi:hypothetical protein